MIKTGVLRDGVECALRYDDLYEEQDARGVPRLLVGTRGSLVDLAAELVRHLRPPWFVLYVLLVPHGRNPPGRYQSPLIDDAEVLSVFLARFRDFFDGDARHHVWIGTRDASGTLVVDQHNHLVAYGPLGAVRDQLIRRGFRSGPVGPREAHTHHFRAEFDGEETSVLARWEWRHFPLSPSDEA